MKLDFAMKKYLKTGINFGKKKSAIKIQKKDSAFMFLDFAKAHEALIERMIKENEHRVMLEALKR